MIKKTNSKKIKTSLIGEKFEHGKNPESLKNLKPFQKGKVVIPVEGQRSMKN